MILDTLNNLKKYATLNPLFPKAIEFIMNSNLKELPLGRNEIMGNEIFANVMEVEPHVKEEIPVETHQKYIDIQIPISGDEIMGHISLDALPTGEYDKEKDVTLYPLGIEASDYFNVKSNMFAIFFPQDGHAPAITSVKLKKVIVKIAVK